MMKRITLSYCLMCLSLFLFCVLNINLAAAEYRSWSYSSLKIKQHSTWEEKEIFNKNENIKDALLYAFLIESSGDDFIIDKIPITIKLTNLPADNIVNFRLIIDENNNGALDENEKKSIGGIGKLDLENQIIIFSEKTDIVSGTELSLLLIADITKAQPGTQIIISTPKEGLTASKKDGSSANINIDSKMPVAAYYFEIPAIDVKLFLEKDRIVGNQEVVIRGIIYYKKSITIDDESLKKTEIAGWNIKKIIFGPEEKGDISIKRFSIYLNLTNKDQNNDIYEIPSFAIPYKNKQNNKKNVVSTKKLVIEKVPLLIETNIFPEIITIGDDIRYSINCFFDESIEITPNTIETFESIKIKELDIKDIKVLEVSKNGYKKITIEILATYFGIPNKRIIINPIEFSVIEKDKNEETKTSIKTIPAGYFFVTPVVADMQFKAPMNYQDTIEPDHKNLMIILKGIRIFIIIIMVAFIAWYPVRSLINNLKDPRSSINLRQAKKKFREQHEKFKKREISLKSYIEYLGEYIQKIENIDTKYDTLGFNMELKKTLKDIWKEIEDFRFGKEMTDKNIEKIIKKIEKELI